MREKVVIPTEGSFCQRPAERKSLKKYIFFFILCFDAWPGIQTWALKLISQYTTNLTTTTNNSYSMLIQVSNVTKISRFNILIRNSF